MFEYQNKLLEKARRLRYLKDQLILEDVTNIRQIASEMNPVIFEPEIRTLNRRLSLERMQNDDDVQEVILKVVKEIGNRHSTRGRMAGDIPESYLMDEPRINDSFNLKGIFNAFAATGHNLFKFVWNYEYHTPVSDDTRIILFCQIASIFSDSLNFTDEYERSGGIEYPIVNVR